MPSLKFRASLAAQPIAPGDPDGYPACWHQQLEWSGHISPLTVPYRVNADTILPPPHTGESYLDLVEVPLNLWVDSFQLTLDGQPVSREDMFYIAGGPPATGRNSQAGIPFRDRL